MKHFIGRKEELKKLNLLAKQKKAGLAVITGRRRIGKSRLIYEFCKKKKHYLFEGLAPGKKITGEYERKNFADQMQNQLRIARPSSDNWTFLLTALANEVKKGPIVIVFDEINWLGHNDPTFLDVLKQIWDQHLSKNRNLILILSGSITTWINREIISNTKFLGRITLAMNLKDLTLSECNCFWGNKKNRISAIEKLRILSMTGGVPRYLEEIIPEQTSEENILRLSFMPDGLLFREFDQLFRDIYSKRTNIYQDIIKTLVDSAKTQNEILKCLKKKRSGVYSEYINELVSIGFIRKDPSWTIDTGHIGKQAYFRISDNYLRFYLQFIFPKISVIQKSIISKPPSIDSKLGFQFENMVINNSHYIYQKLNIDKNDIIATGPYFQSKTTIRDGCQIDLLIQTRQKVLYICEIKFSINKIGIKIISEVENKINKLKIPKYFSIRPIIISVNGVTNEVENKEYFDHIINYDNYLT